MAAPEITAAAYENTWRPSAGPSDTIAARSDKIKSTSGTVDRGVSTPPLSSAQRTHEAATYATQVASAARVTGDAIPASVLIGGRLGRIGECGFRFRFKCPVAR